MKIKLALYGFGSHQFSDGFFDMGHDFRDGLDLGLQLTFVADRGSPSLTCDELEVVIDQNQGIPRHYFADFELEALQVHTSDKLKELAARFGELFREYVFTFIDNGSFVGVRVRNTQYAAKWSPHHHELK